MMSKRFVTSKERRPRKSDDKKESKEAGVDQGMDNLLTAKG